MPPSPDATVTYWRPLCVYVIAVELTLDPVLNCQRVLPVCSSSAMNSPDSLPVNMSRLPLPACGRARQIGKGDFPFPLTCQWIDRREVLTTHLVWCPDPGDDAGRCFHHGSLVAALSSFCMRGMFHVLA